MECMDNGIWMVLVDWYLDNIISKIHNACLSQSVCVTVCKQISSMAATARLMILGLWIPVLFNLFVWLPNYKA